MLKFLPGHTNPKLGKGDSLCDTIHQIMTKKHEIIKPAGKPKTFGTKKNAKLGNINTLKKQITFKKSRSLLPVKTGIKLRF